MKVTFIEVLVIAAVIAILAVMAVKLTGCSEAVDVTREELGPRAMRDKYVWFKQQHERIEKAREDIKTFENSVDKVKDKYAGYGEQKDWPPDVRFQYNSELERGETDLKAMISHHDSMVRDYNAQSKNFLWEKFDREGSLPRNHDEYAKK